MIIKINRFISIYDSNNSTRYINCLTLYNLQTFILLQPASLTVIHRNNDKIKSGHIIFCHCIILSQDTVQSETIKLSWNAKTLLNTTQTMRWTLCNFHTTVEIMYGWTYCVASGPTRIRIMINDTATRGQS